MVGTARRSGFRHRGGAANSPAAVYALGRYIDWLEKYAPPEAPGMTFSEAGPVPGRGNVVQQIFRYTAFTSSLATDYPRSVRIDDERNAVDEELSLYAGDVGPL